jgi:DUF4097 and DUF4098 domain-containing protein YvlB
MELIQSKESEMSRSNFSTPSAIAVTLDLYVADVRLAAADRADTVVEVRPSDPGKPADVRAADSTRVEYDEATRTLSVASRKPRSRLATFSGKRPESIDLLIQLPAGSGLRGQAGLGDFQSDGPLGAVTLKTGLGAVRLAETGPLNLRAGAGPITVEAVTGPAEVHCGSGDIRIGTIDGTAEVTSSNGKVRVAAVTGPATVKGTNGPVTVGRALSGITAASANGEVRIGEVTRGTVSATAKNGSVEVGVRQGSTAFLDLSTAVGRVYNELASADAPQPGEQADTVEVHASTKLGDITIRRAPRLDQ